MKKMMMCMFYFGILTSVLFLIRGYNCPINCTCEATCNLVTHDDEIVTDVSFISIHGRLCPQHYTLLIHAGGGLHLFLSLLVCKCYIKIHITQAPYILWQEEDFCHFFILHFYLYNRHSVQFHVGYSNIRVFYTLTINFLYLYIHIKLMKNT